MVQTSIVLAASAEGSSERGGGRRRHGEQQAEAMTPYERLQHVLSHDKRCLREISLGMRVGFYRLKGDIGAGNFSQVKAAVHSLTKEMVAVKILDKTALDHKTLRLLTREITSMERLKHPNIIRLYEVVETPSKIHMIMEYASGGELFNRVMKQGRLSEPEAKIVFCQIVSAIKHMHDRDIVHRDLKAENVFYAAPQCVKVGDFGFSRRSAPAEHLATFCGSPPYAAPELFRDEAYEGRYVDLWALGVVLHFMVSGATPFRGDTVGKLRRCILAGEYVEPSFVSPECRSLISGLLRPRPRDRLGLDEVARSPWMRGHELPPPLRAFDDDPESALSSSAGADEREATRALRALGITASVIRRAKSAAAASGDGGSARNSVTGAYRIVLHRIQRERSLRSSPAGVGLGAYENNGDDYLGDLDLGGGGGTAADRGIVVVRKRDVTRRGRQDTYGGGAARMYGSAVDGKPHSKFCTII